MGMMPKKQNKEIQVLSPVPPIPSVPTSPTPNLRDHVKEVFKEKAGDDKILAPVAKTRDRSIELQALLKSTLESPFVAQLTMGQDQATAMKTFEYVFDAVLAIYTKTK